ncbi:MAG: mevalonate kinase [Candidatus Diapherotrites archaeon]|nr:mevalonate kinase [Candidatus Diapherotrites archaeon]
MGFGQGFGKTIVFGEHFVVYGLPAIASAITSSTTAEVKRSKDGKYKLIDNRPETPGYKKQKQSQQEESIKLIFKFLGIDPAKTPVEITLGGDLVAASGVGASAASCAAIARALNEEFSLGLDDEKINEAAFEGEKGYHGTPSGIDNTAAVYGGLIKFTKGQKGTQMEKIKIEPIEIVLGNTGLTSDTTAVVGDVKKEKEKNQGEFEKIFKEYLRISEQALSAFRENDIGKIGKLMNENHKLLQKIGVSCKELEELVEIARENGAIGAKLTGTGRGGLMIALTPEKTLQEKVAKAIEKTGKTAFRTRIG